MYSLTLICYYITREAAFQQVKGIFLVKIAFLLTVEGVDLAELPLKGETVEIILPKRFV